MADFSARQDMKSAQMQYYQINGHGDITGITDNNGKVLNSYTYDIWGGPEKEEETVPNVLRYSGEYWDSTTGLQYLRARWYDPSMGRFMSEDTYKGQMDNPLSLNGYTYVSNNPLKYIDPTGHWEETDVKYSSAIQDEIKYLTGLWYAADGNSDMQKQIQNAASVLRNIGDTNANYTVLRLNTFIPLDSVSIPGGPTFSGDGANRGFDVNSMAVRTQQYIVVDIDMGATTANYVGVTHDLTSGEQQRASNSGMSVTSLRQEDTTFIHATISEGNPLV